MLKKVAKRPAKKAKKRIAVRRISFATVRLKDPCYGPLTDRSQAQAADADRLGNLDLLDGKLQCDGCGKMVGARKAIDRNHYEVYPRPHERYKEPRQPARKRDEGKRIRR